MFTSTFRFCEVAHMMQDYIYKIYLAIDDSIWSFTVCGRADQSVVGFSYKTFKIKYNNKFLFFVGSYV